VKKTAAIGVTASTIGVTILFILGVVAWSIGRGAAGSATTAPAAVKVAPTAMPHYYLSIETPDMLGGTEDTGPAYVPASFTLPANEDVTLTIVNFDDATALPAGSEDYATAKGIKGSLSIEPLDTVNPNGVAKAVTTATSLDPAKGVSHTFTIVKLGLNVPVAPKARTTFTFHTGAAGSYTWQCMDPCGCGDTGWGCAMGHMGYMRGTVTVA